MCCGLKIFRKKAQCFLLYKMYRGDLIFSLFLRFNYSKSDHSKIYNFFFLTKNWPKNWPKFFFWLVSISYFSVSVLSFWLVYRWFNPVPSPYKYFAPDFRHFWEKKFSRFFGSWPIYWALGWPIAWLAYRWSDPPPRPKKIFASKSCFWVISSISEKNFFFDFSALTPILGPWLAYSLAGL